MKPLRVTDRDGVEHRLTADPEATLMESLRGAPDGLRVTIAPEE